MKDLASFRFWFCSRSVELAIGRGSGIWRRRSLLLAAGCVLSMTLSGANVNAQSVIQLPSFQQFSYSGSVLVPDRGSAYLGGVKRSASGQSQRGLNRTAGRTISNSGASVTATIIDLQQIDRQILADGRRPNVARQRSASRPVVDRTEEGKSLVRFARRQYKQGDKSGAHQAYQMAIEILDGRLQQLAIAEFRRLY